MWAGNPRRWTTGSTAVAERKPWDSNPQRAWPAPVFETGSSSGRMTSSSCGSWNRTNASGFRARHRYQQRLPRIVVPKRRIAFHSGSGRRIRTSVSCFKGRQPTVSRSPISGRKGVPRGSRTRLSRLEVWRLGRSARGTRSLNSGSRGTRTHNGVTRTCFRAAFVLPRPRLSPPSPVGGGALLPAG